MGTQQQAAWNVDLLVPVWPPLHDEIVCSGEHKPIIKERCTQCQRVFQWCYPSKATVDLIRWGIWRCADCPAVPHPITEPEAFLAWAEGHQGDAGDGISCSICRAVSRARIATYERRVTP